MHDRWRQLFSDFPDSFWTMTRNEMKKIWTVGAEECPINWGVAVTRVSDRCFQNDSLLGVRVCVCMLTDTQTLMSGTREAASFAAEDHSQPTCLIGTPSHFMVNDVRHSP